MYQIETNALPISASAQSDWQPTCFHCRSFCLGSSHLLFFLNATQLNWSELDWL